MNTDKITNYNAAGLSHAPNAFVVVLTKGEGFKTSNDGEVLGHLNKNTGLRTGYVPKRNAKNGQDPENAWGITRPALDDYYRLKGEELSKKISKLKKRAENVKHLLRVKNTRQSAIAQMESLQREINALSQTKTKLELDKQKNNSLKNLSQETAKEVFTYKFFDRPDFEKLPVGIATIAADFGYISHPKHVVKAMRSFFKIKTTQTNEVLDEATLKAAKAYVEEHGEMEFIKAFKPHYLKYLQRCAARKVPKKLDDGTIIYVRPKQNFMKEWRRRVEDVTTEAIEIAQAKEKQRIDDLKIQEFNAYKGSSEIAMQRDAFKSPLDTISTYQKLNMLNQPPQLIEQDSTKNTPDSLFMRVKLFFNKPAPYIS